MQGTSFICDTQTLLNICPIFWLLTTCLTHRHTVELRKPFPSTPCRWATASWPMFRQLHAAAWVLRSRTKAPGGTGFFEGNWFCRSEEDWGSPRAHSCSSKISPRASSSMLFCVPFQKARPQTCFSALGTDSVKGSIAFNKLLTAQTHSFRGDHWRPRPMQRVNIQEEASTN